MQYYFRQRAALPTAMVIKAIRFTSNLETDYSSAEKTGVERVRRDPAFPIRQY
jgi:hypothetical protein